MFEQAKKNADKTNSKGARQAKKKIKQFEEVTQAQMSIHVNKPLPMIYYRKVFQLIFNKSHLSNERFMTR